MPFGGFAAGSDAGLRFEEGRQSRPMDISVHRPRGHSSTACGSTYETSTNRLTVSSLQARPVRVARRGGGRATTDGDWWRFRASAVQAVAACGLRALTCADRGAEDSRRLRRWLGCGVAACRKGGSQGLRTDMSADLYRFFGHLRDDLRNLHKSPYGVVAASSSCPCRAARGRPRVDRRRLVEISCVCGAGCSGVRPAGASEAKSGAARYWGLRVAKSGTFPLSRAKRPSSRERSRRSEACAISALSFVVSAN